MTKVDQITTEYAWAAGFIDGDGCFQLCYSKPKEGRNYDRPLRIILTFTQVEIQPLQRLQILLGGRITGPYKKRNNRQETYHYRLSMLGLQKHIDELWLYMSEPKKLQYKRCGEKLVGKWAK